MNSSQRRIQRRKQQRRSGRGSWQQEIFLEIKEQQEMDRGKTVGELMAAQLTIEPLESPRFGTFDYDVEHNPEHPVRAAVNKKMRELTGVPLYQQSRADDEASHG